MIQRQLNTWNLKGPGLLSADLAKRAAFHYSFLFIFVAQWTIGIQSCWTPRQGTGRESPLTIRESPAQTAPRREPIEKWRMAPWNSFGPWAMQRSTSLDS